MRVLFLAPQYPPEMQQFTRGLAEVGAEVVGVADVPQDQLPPEVKRALSAYVQVPELLDEAAAAEHIVRALGNVRFDRIEALWEPLVLLAATLRERWGIPGMSRDTVLGFRDKGLMKARLRKAGLRVPRAARVQGAAELLEAARHVGFPMAVKPIAGAGSKDTHRVDDVRQLEALLPRLRHVREILAEEFVVGEEYTYDTLCIDGTPVFESVAHYIPKPIEARSQEWISPAQEVFRDPYQPELLGGIELGRRVLRALGMGTGFTHMEWYRTPAGEAVFGEIACRSPGGNLVDQMNYANDFDVYREWARVVCWKSMEARPARRYHCAMAFKRAQGQGRIQRIEGMEALRALCGPSLVAEQLLPIGSPRRDWRQTLVSDGYLIVRHPDARVCRRMMQAIVTDVRMYAG